MMNVYPVMKNNYILTKQHLTTLIIYQIISDLHYFPQPIQQPV